jgi:drug/metabolite transporter (DMT)-like permease
VNLYNWIYFTLLAATMQAVRTAGQKQLGSKLNTMAASGVRYIFALPFGYLYLYGVMEYTELAVPSLNSQFVIYALLACAAQIIGTACLVAAFKYRNFAVSSSLSKTEAIQIAIIGAILFSSPLSLLGWVSVIISAIGVFFLAKVKFHLKDLIANPGAGYGLASGLGLAFATLLIREASLALSTNLFLSAAVTLVFMITVQSLFSAVYLWFEDKSQFALMVKHWRLALFVGVTSVLGSIGWFTGASLQLAAYVKALGQVEFFITLLLTYRVFKEKISLAEYIGMVLIVLSVLILLLWA